MLDKDTVAGKTDFVSYGISSHQGWRRTQEDAHCVEEIDSNCYLFGIFDGHGGPEVAQFCSRNMATEIQKLELFVDGDFHGSLREVFHRMDSMMRSADGKKQLVCMRPQEDVPDNKANEFYEKGSRENAIDLLRRMIVLPRGKNRPSHVDNSSDTNEFSSKSYLALEEVEIQSGCTAIVALLKHNELFIANAGDSRAVLCRDGNAIALSNDHKPTNLEERERIINAGGFINEIGGVCRVNGNLNLSRAIGDLRYKTNIDLDPALQIITAEPDVKRIEITSRDRFLVMACDGIWDVMQK